MNLDRAELTGTGAAVAFHVVLIAALSMSLASVAPSPEPPAMEVELIDEVGLQSAAPAAVAPPPPSRAPEPVEVAAPVPAPRVEPAPPPPVIRPTPAPVVRATPPPAAKPAPSRPQRPAPAVSQPRRSRIGEDFLKGIDDAPADERPARPAAATFNAAAKASVAQMIAEQIRPCALQQRELGPGANRIQVVLNLQLHPSGRLRRSPTVVRVTGDDEENSQYVDLVVNQAIASYRQCSPLRLPAELYQTPEGGWANINMRYRVP